MVITLGQARNLIADYSGKAGKCPDSDAVREFVKEVVQRLLHRGAHGNLRKWCFHTCRGCFTAPPDMEVALKVKIDGYPSSVWSKWYEFQSCNQFDVSSSRGANNSGGVSAGHSNSGFCTGLQEMVDRYPTVYDMPECGGRVSAIPFCEEDEDAHIIVQGLDMHGRDVFTEHHGERIHGERLTINKRKKTYSKTKFSKITAVQKTQTNHYVRLYWFNPENKEQGLLSEYRPTDTDPCFRRFRVPGVDPHCCTKITVLGRVKLLDCYHDNDVLPVTSIPALKKMAQLIQSEENDQDVGMQRHKKDLSDELIEDENQYQRTGDESFEFECEVSPGNLCNLI